MFRAYDAERERLVAVKLFKLDLPPEKVHQLVAEFQQLIAADLQHPVIARPIATGMSGVAAYLAQDYVAAESLDLAVREYGPAPSHDALRVAAQLAGALDFAAVVSLHHGALHPRDVLLSPDETRLTGVGVAQALQKVGVAVPVRRPYTAPERVAGAAIAGRADLFSLAAVVFELLTGKRVPGPGDSAVEAVGDVAGADRVALRAVFARALADAPEARFATGLAFVDALRGALPQTSSATRQPERKSGRGKADDRAAAPASALPFDVPEASDRADLEALPDVPGPSTIVPPSVAPDLPLAAAEEQRYADVEVAPAQPTEEVEPVSLDAARDEPERRDVNIVTSSAFADLGDAAPRRNDRSRASAWPIVAALAVGTAVGFVVGYGVGDRARPEPSSSASTSNGREFTDAAVKNDEARAGSADRAGAPAASTPPPSTAAGARIAPDARVSGSPATAPAPRAPAGAAPAGAAPGAVTDIGHLLVRSTPAGARVTVDGKEAGKTPAVVRDLPVGAHRVEVSRDGYAPVERRVTITQARPSVSLTLPLTRERVDARAAPPTAPEPSTPGTMGRFVGTPYVDSRPSGAKVFLDGKLIGTTPLSIASIAAGEHAVRLEYDGYRRWTSSVRVVASEQNRVTASLER